MSVQLVLDRPMLANPAGEQNRVSLECGQAGDRVHGHGLPLPAGQRPASADKFDGLSGVREELPAKVGGLMQADHADRASLGAAVAAGPLTGCNSDLRPRQRAEPAQQRRVVALTVIT
jgi:hypothetical protein